MRIHVGPGSRTTSLQHGRLVTDDGFFAGPVAKEAIDMAKMMTGKSKTGGIRVVEVELQFGERPYPIVPVRPDDDLGETAAYIESVYLNAISKCRTGTGSSQRSC